MKYASIDPECRICGNCSLHRALHSRVMECPTVTMSDRLRGALRLLVEAYQSGDQERIFVARGDVQQYGGGL